MADVGRLRAKHSSASARQPVVGAMHFIRSPVDEGRSSCTVVASQTPFLLVIAGRRGRTATTYLHEVSCVGDIGLLTSRNRSPRHEFRSTLCEVRELRTVPLRLRRDMLHRLTAMGTGAS